MSDQSRNPRSHLSTLRVWHEELGEGRQEWRGKLHHVASNEVTHAARLGGAASRAAGHAAPRGRHYQCGRRAGTGNYYHPAVQAQFNEAVEPGSVNDQTVIVTDASGKPVRADVRYDAAIDQMQRLLREEPHVGKAYAVTIRASNSFSSPFNAFQTLPVTLTDRPACYPPFSNK